MHAACHYTVSAQHPANHFFQVSLVIQQPNPNGQIVWLPNWILGSYMIRDFARHIVSVSAKSAQGLLLNVKKLTKNQWQIEACTTEHMVLNYEVYAWDLSVRGAHLDQTHGYFNGVCLLLAAEGKAEDEHRLTLKPPVGVTGWRVATTMTPHHIDDQGFGVYQAANYTELTDHPLEMGKFSEVTFEAGQTPHRVAITGKHRADTERLATDLSCICRAAIRFWGDDSPPFSQYLFQVMAVGTGYGGLEHRSSTSLLCSRDDLPLSIEPMVKIGEKYRTFLGLCSHEYFHSWLVKRIQPDVLIKPDLHQENYTELLWVFEGFTSYYDDLLLARAGIITPQEYLDVLAQTITRHLKTPGRLMQSVTDSSFDAWTKYYKQDENTPNSVVSYYIKGSLVALCIDLKLRQLSDNKYSLDDVMRLLWQQYGKQQRGVTRDTVQQLCQQLVQDDLSAFWQQCLYSTVELPFAELLAAQGVTVQYKYDNPRNQPLATLGIRGQAAEGGFQVQTVWRGSVAEAMGLSAGDVIIAAGGLKVGAQFEKTIASYAIGDTLNLHWFRRDELMHGLVILAASAPEVCVLQLGIQARELSERWILAK